MPDEQTSMPGGETQAASVAVQDKPSAPQEQTVGQEKGSAPTVAASVATAEKRDWRTELDSVEERELLQHPKLQSVIERRAQARLDKALQEQRQRWQAEQDQQLAQIRAQQQEEEMLKADPLDLGERIQNDVKLRRQLQPYIQQAEQQMEQKYRRQLDDRFTVAYQEFYREIGLGVIEAIRAGELDITEEDWNRAVMSNPHIGKVLIDTLREQKGKLTKKQQAALQAEMAKLSQRQERESQVEQRAQEQSPDLGGGSAAGGEAEFKRQYAEGRLNSPADHARAKRLLGWT